MINQVEIKLEQQDDLNQLFTSELSVVLTAYGSLSIIMLIEGIELITFYQVIN